jgi:hypothetical protein
MADFVQDARTDIRFPPASSWTEVQAYLRAEGASGTMLQSARRAWMDYEHEAANEARRVLARDSFRRVSSERRPMREL